MTDLAQGGALGLGQQEPAFQLGFEDAVLGGEIFIAEQESGCRFPRECLSDLLCDPVWSKNSNALNYRGLRTGRARLNCPVRGFR